MIKDMIKEIMIKYPKMTQLERKDDTLKFGLVYPYSYEYDKYYNNNIFNQTNGSIKIDIAQEIENKNNLKELYKIKRFLKERKRGD